MEGEKRTHSTLGIASFCISIGIPLINILFFVIANISGEFSFRPTKEIPTWVSIFQIFWIIFVCLSPFAWLVGVGLGIGGLFQKNRKKLFPILGLIISVITVLLFGVVLFFALATL